jgi:lipopolysaccharide transport system permease protein
MKINSVVSLSYSIAKANFKLRNEGSYLGILWYLLSPLSLFLILFFIRGSITSTEGVLYYPLYLLIGLVMINFFSQLVHTAIGVIQNNSGFIKSIKIPLEVFVLSTVMQSIFSHIFELLLIAVFFLFFNVPLIGIIFYIVVFIVFIIFTLGVCFFCATLGVYVNDLGNIWTIASQLLFFITPTFYVVHPGTPLYLGNLFNPLFYFITTARDVAIYGTLPPLWMIAVIVGVSVVSLFVGLFSFNRFKGRFAELV